MLQRGEEEMGEIVGNGGEEGRALESRVWT